MNKNWHGLMTILEIEHTNSNGEVIWRDENLLNIFHTTGEEYLLKVAFDGKLLPVYYYLGLDDRVELDVADQMTDIVDEPSVNGYLRQTVDAGGWTVEVKNGVNRATSPIVTFNASGGGTWGPVRNLFLTNEIGGAGLLMASVALSAMATLSSGDNISMRISLALQDCTSC